MHAGGHTKPRKEYSGNRQMCLGLLGSLEDIFCMFLLKKRGFNVRKKYMRSGCMVIAA